MESGCPGMREGCPDKRGVLIRGVKYSVLIKHNALRCPFAGEFTWALIFQLCNRMPQDIRAEMLSNLLGYLNISLPPFGSVRFTHIYIIDP